MRKPAEIIEIEEAYGIELTYLPGGNTYGYYSSNFYQCDRQGKVSELNLRNNNIDNLLVLEKLPHLIYLDLGDNKIKDIIILGKLRNLKTLNISNNQIVNISILGKLLKLEKLYLGGNQISKIMILEKLNNLTWLDLSSNKVSDFRVLEKLIHLAYLNLRNNQVFDFIFLEKLINLTWLNLSGNKINDINFLKNLKKLISLFLDNNQIKEINALERLDKLTFLTLHYNKISDIKPLEKLTNITRLYLNNNRINDISILEKLTNLTELNLSDNQIEDISSLKELNKLTKLNLRGNQIKEVSLFQKQTNLIELNLDLNQINDIAYFYNIILHDHLTYLNVANNPFVKEYGLVLMDNENHLDIIRNELKKIQIIKEKSVSIKLPLKVMLLGNHASGKSSFLHYFTREEFPSEEIDSTNILTIQPYPHIEENALPVKFSLPDAIFYDFGGQDYYHGVYQAFFTIDAVNLLFWHTESDVNEEKKDSNTYITHHFNRAYWLGQIRYALNKQRESGCGKEDLLWVVQTYADQDMQSNWKGTDAISHEFFLSLSAKKSTTKNEHAIGYLISSLKEEIEKNPEVEKTQNEIDLYQYIIRQRGFEPVNISELDGIYKMGKAALRGELTQLARRGVVLYYNNEKIGDKVWLHPADTVQHIHDGILNKELIGSYAGKVPVDTFKDKDPDLLELLINEKVIFKDEAGQQYIIPGYLRLADEQINEDVYWMKLNFSKPAFVLKFESFIPFGLINQLICYYGQNPDHKKYYRNLLLFTYKAFNAKVMIQLDFKNLEIFVCIHSLDPGKAWASDVSRKVLDDILDMYWGRTLPLLKTAKDRDIEKKKREQIPDDLYLSVDGLNFIHFAGLEREQDFSKPFIAYPLKEINGIRSIDKTGGKGCNVYAYKHLSDNAKLGAMKKIFISYSRHDQKYLYELDKHLYNLKDQGLIEVYYDELTGLGENIHKTIREQLEASDYVIALVSVDFINTPYISDVELKYVQENEKRLIPVIVRDCDWENHKILGRIYTIQKGNCISALDAEGGFEREASMTERDSKWKRVVKELREKLDFPTDHS